MAGLCRGVMDHNTKHSKYSLYFRVDVDSALPNQTQSLVVSSARWKNKMQYIYIFQFYLFYPKLDGKVLIKCM